MNSTSSVLLAEVGEPPDVAQPHTEAEHGEEELERGVPGGAPRPARLHILHVVGGGYGSRYEWLPGGRQW